MKVNHSRFRKISAALLYMSTAVALILFNKIVLSEYKFSYPNLIVLLQLVFSATALRICKSMGLIKYRAFDRNTLLQVLPMSLTFVLFLVAGMVSLQRINITMYTALRRLTLVLVMILDYALQGKTTTRPVKQSIGIMVAGAFIAAAGDLEFDMTSYQSVMIYNVLTALYLVLIGRAKKKTQLETFGLMYYNNIICIPCLLALCLYTGELRDVLNFPHLREPKFCVALCCTTVLAFVLNYAIFFNTAVNSALTQSVCGQLKDFFTVLVGLLLLDASPYTPLNVIGVAVSFLGSGLYAKAKYQESRAALLPRNV